MKKLAMVDLRTQYDHIKKEIDASIQSVLNSTAFVKGPKVTEFQHHFEDYLDVKHVITTGNGTDALQAALMALGLKPGDEVITPTFTFIATAEVVALLGYTPVVVDVDPETYCISLEAIKKAITPKTKVIVPVHLFGQNADMEGILKIAEEHHLYVVEDACQSVGSYYTFSDGRTCASGTMGDIGCTSFFPSKNLGCYGDGGAIYTNNDELAEKLHIITNHGMTIRYHHDMVGINSRLDGIQAAILDVKLPHLNAYIKSRQSAAHFYNEAFKNCAKIKTPVVSPKTTHAYHQYTVVLSEDVDRAALQAALKDKGIPSMIYYPIPLHMQKAYQDPRYKEGAFPQAEMLARRVLSFPIHTELSDEQLEYITSNVLDALK